MAKKNPIAKRTARMPTLAFYRPDDKLPSKLLASEFREAASRARASADKARKEGRKDHGKTPTILVSWVKLGGLQFGFIWRENRGEHIRRREEQEKWIAESRGRGHSKSETPDIPEWYGRTLVFIEGKFFLTSGIGGLPTSKEVKGKTAEEAAQLLIGYGRGPIRKISKREAMSIAGKMGRPYERMVSRHIARSSETKYKGHTIRTFPVMVDSYHEWERNKVDHWRSQVKSGPLLKATRMDGPYGWDTGAGMAFMEMTMAASGISQKKKEELIRKARETPKYGHPRDIDADIERGLAYDLDLYDRNKIEEYAGGRHALRHRYWSFNAKNRTDALKVMKKRIDLLEKRNEPSARRRTDRARESRAYNVIASKSHRGDVMLEKASRMFQASREVPAGPKQWEMEDEARRISREARNILGKARAEYLALGADSKPKGNPKKNPAKKKPAKKKAARKKTPAYQLLINRCQKLWTHYCERPSKKRLEALYVHLDKMKDSTSKKVAAERSRCLRAANKEAKRLKYTRKK